MKFREKHHEFLKTTPFYYLDDQKRLFVHGGIDPSLPLDKQEKMTLMWDRGLVSNDPPEIKEYKEIYVGHTSIYGASHIPAQKKNIFYMDTGAGWEGKLSLMDIDNYEIFQSDVVADLYPDVIGRGQ